MEVLGMLDVKELKTSLKLYKDCLGEEKLKVKESARVPIERGQIRPVEIPV
jgi:hypothetical protein